MEFDVARQMKLAWVWSSWSGVGSLLSSDVTHSCESGPRACVRVLAPEAGKSVMCQSEGAPGKSSHEATTAALRDRLCLLP